MTTPRGASFASRDPQLARCGSPPRARRLGHGLARSTTPTRASSATTGSSALQHALENDYLGDAGRDRRARPRPRARRGSGGCRRRAGAGSPRASDAAARGIGRGRPRPRGARGPLRRRLQPADSPRTPRWRRWRRRHAVARRGGHAAATARPPAPRALPWASSRLAAASRSPGLPPRGLDERTPGGRGGRHWAWPDAGGSEHSRGSSAPVIGARRGVLRRRLRRVHAESSADARRRRAGASAVTRRWPSLFCAPRGMALTLSAPVSRTPSRRSRPSP